MIRRRERLGTLTGGGGWWRGFWQLPSGYCCAAAALALQHCAGDGSGASSKLSWAFCILSRMHCSCLLSFGHCGNSNCPLRGCCLSCQGCLSHTCLQQHQHATHMKARRVLTYVIQPRCHFRQQHHPKTTRSPACLAATLHLVPPHG